MSRQESMKAVALEVVPGTFLQLFGIGHMYKGKIGMGLALLLSYWALQSLNVFLIGVGGIGFITGPLTWLFYTVFSATNVLSEGRS